ncbi:MAG: hypothetical protein IJP31_05025 [Lachnospiraceae bacterium]|nr:hypothetical protein [Lachnospiraceae bacterium]
MEGRGRKAKTVLWILLAFLLLQGEKGRVWAKEGAEPEAVQAEVVEPDAIQPDVVQAESEEGIRTLEKGDFVEPDFGQGEIVFRADIGEETPFLFKIERKEVIEGELDTWVVEVQVYREGETQPFDTFMTETTAAGGFSFLDFNCDGYQDLIVKFYYGVNGGTQKIHLWSPSGQRFVEGPEEMEYFGNYRLDQKQRLLQIFTHGSAIDGFYWLYQWENEMDYKVIRKFKSLGEYFPGEEKEIGVRVDIRDYHNGQEEILCNFLYDYDTFEEMTEEIWGLYDLQIQWKSSLIHPRTKEQCMVYFGKTGYWVKESTEVEASAIPEIGLYILGEDTRIIKGVILDLRKWLMWGLVEASP